VGKSPHLYPLPWWERVRERERERVGVRGYRLTYSKLGSISTRYN